MRYQELQSIDVGKLFRSVGQTFYNQGIYFFEGDCLNFAAAMHGVLSEIGITSEVKLLMRSDEDDERLSHVVVEANGMCYDWQGGDADTEWENEFNYTQRLNDDPEEDFWLEDLPMSLDQFIRSANAQHGDSEKLVDKPALRSQIADEAKKELALMMST